MKFWEARVLAGGSAFAALAVPLVAAVDGWPWAAVLGAVAGVLAVLSHDCAIYLRQALEVDRRRRYGTRRLEAALRGSRNVRVFEAPSVEQLVEMWERDSA